MLPNSLKNKKVFQKRNSRSTSELNYVTKSLSAKSSRKKHLVKAKSEYTMSMSIIVMFESALSQLKIDSDNKEILEKLIKIEKVLKEKLLLINKNKHNNVGFFKELTSSMGNLNFEAFEGFFERMNCPFCSEPKADKIKLIKHLDNDCKPRINKMFSVKCQLDFSVFQILPNNTFKCNICPLNFIEDLNNYLEHLQNDFHISVYAKVAKSKNLTDFFFCSCCKVQVPNNYTQVQFHMNHHIHKSKSESSPKSDKFMKSGIFYVYLRNKKFKCIACPGIFFKTPGDIMKHFEDHKNSKKVTKKANLNEEKFFCEVCSVKVQMTEIFNHFLLSDHKEIEIIEEKYEMCFFCGFVCGNLMDLSLHMESGCSGIDSIKKQNPEFKKTARNDLKDKATDESNIDGGHIIIKDYKNMPTLLSYFEQFGEITSLETYNDKHVMLKFKEKSIATCILLLKNRVCINGVELEITTEDKLFKSEGKTVASKEEGRSLSESENSHSSCDSSENEESNDSSEDRVSNYDEVLQKDELQILFQKVTSHLMNISQRISELTMQTAEELTKRLEQIKIRCGITAQNHLVLEIKITAKAQIDHYLLFEKIVSEFGYTVTV